MDTDSLKITAEVFWIRTRGYLRLVAQLVGLVFVLVGVFNVFAVPIADVGPIATQYRVFGEILLNESGRFVYLDDILLIAVGSVVAWFS